MPDHKYSVCGIFPSLQGEGYNSGCPATFIRFAGCNLWSGKDEDRERDSERNNSLCPLFCDTDFVTGKEDLTASEILDRVLKVSFPSAASGLVVVTGGEPALQYDEELHRELTKRFSVAIETNGTIKLKVRPSHVTLSPKNLDFILTDCDEIKVIYPTCDPDAILKKWIEMVTMKSEFKQIPSLFIQPEDGLNYKKNLNECVEFLKTNNSWRLSIQIHKIVGVP